jgi:hypothetical protein
MRVEQNVEPIEKTDDEQTGSTHDKRGQCNAREVRPDVSMRVSTSHVPSSPGQQLRRSVSRRAGSQLKNSSDPRILVFN